MADKVVELTRKHAKLIALRVVDLIFSIVVFASISDISRTPLGVEVCWYGISFNSGAYTFRNSICGFGTFVGVISFLFDLLILALIYLPVCCVNAILMPTFIPFVLFLFGCFMLLAWFANAANLASGYTLTCATCEDDFGTPCDQFEGQSKALTAVVFSWFCFLFWCVTLWTLYMWWQKGWGWMNIAQVKGKSVQTSPNPPNPNNVAPTFTPTQTKTDQPDPSNDDLTSDSDAPTDEDDNDERRKKKPRRPRAFNLKKSLRYVKKTLKQRQQTGLDHERFTEEVGTLWKLMDVPTAMGSYNGRVRSANVRQGTWASQNKDTPMPEQLPADIQERVDSIVRAGGDEPSFWDFANWLLQTQGMDTDRIKQPVNGWAQPNF